MPFSNIRHQGNFSYVNIVFVYLLITLRESTTFGYHSDAFVFYVIERLVTVPAFDGFSGNVAAFDEMSDAASFNRLQSHFASIFLAVLVLLLGWCAEQICQVQFRASIAHAFDADRKTVFGFLYGIAQTGSIDTGSFPSLCLRLIFCFYLVFSNRQFCRIRTNRVSKEISQ